MKSDRRSETRSWLPVLMGAVAVAVGLIAFWALGLSAADAPSSSELETPSENANRAPDAPKGVGAVAGAAAGEVAEKRASPAIHLEPRLFTDYGFRVGLDASWTVETGPAGLRVTGAGGRFYVLRTPAPTRLGATAQPPGNQVAVITRRIAGTDVLCTVDPDASDEVRAVALEVCKTVSEQGGIGVLTGFKCEADADIDLPATSAAVEAIREEIIECFTVAHRSEVDMAVGQASVAVEPSPDGVPLTILVGGDVPTERSFRWLKGCMTHLFRQLTYTRQAHGDGMLRCEFNWSLE